MAAMDEDRFVLHAQPIVGDLRRTSMPALRAAAADARRRRRADPPGDVPADRRALRPDRGRSIAGCSRAGGQVLHEHDARPAPVTPVRQPVRPDDGRRRIFAAGLAAIWPRAGSRGTADGRDDRDGRDRQPRARPRAGRHAAPAGLPAGTGRLRRRLRVVLLPEAPRVRFLKIDGEFIESSWTTRPTGSSSRRWWRSPAGWAPRRSRNSSPTVTRSSCARARGRLRAGLPSRPARAAGRASAGDRGYLRSAGGVGPATGSCPCTQRSNPWAAKSFAHPEFLYFSPAWVAAIHYCAVRGVGG